MDRKFFGGSTSQYAPGKEIAIAKLANDVTGFAKNGQYQTVTGLQISVPAGVPVELEALFHMQIAQGTVAANTVINPQARMCDTSAGPVIFDAWWQYLWFPTASGTTLTPKVILKASVPAFSVATNVVVQILPPNNAALGNFGIFSVFAPNICYLRAVARG